MLILPIYMVLFFSLFGGLFIRMGVPNSFAIGTEFLIYLQCLIALLDLKNKNKHLLHLFYIFVFFVTVGIVSAILNYSGFSGIIFSLRRLFRFYFFYLAIINLDIEDKNAKSIITFLSFLLLFQLPVVAYRFFLYGIDERTHGAYSAVHTGSLTTILPIMVIFYTASFYLLYKSQLRYIFAGIGYIVFSIVGAKRAVAFLYPIQFFAIYHFIYLKGRNVATSKRFFMSFALVSMICLVSGSILYFNKTLNPEKRISGSIDPSYALDYAKDYTSRINIDGYTTGRYSTTIRTFEVLYNAGIVHFFFGVGPGKTTSSVFDSLSKRGRGNTIYEDFKIIYGLTSMTRILIEYGIFGVLAYSFIIFYFARMCSLCYTYEIDQYWKAFTAGSVGFSFSMIFFFFAYGHAAFWGDTAPALYYFNMAIVHTRFKRLTLLRNINQINYS